MTVLNSYHMALWKAFSFSGRLIWTWKTKGDGFVTRKYLKVGREAIVGFADGSWGMGILGQRKGILRWCLMRYKCLRL